MANRAHSQNPLLISMSKLGYWWIDLINDCYLMLSPFQLPKHYHIYCFFSFSLHNNSVSRSLQSHSTDEETEAPSIATVKASQFWRHAWKCSNKTSVLFLKGKLTALLSREAWLTRNKQNQNKHNNLLNLWAQWEGRRGPQHRGEQGLLLLPTWVSAH